MGIQSLIHKYSARQGISGFTLIEILVVVAIVGIASGAVVLAVRDAGQRELDAYSARIVDALERGRSMSRSTGVTLRAEFLAQNSADSTTLSGGHALLVFDPELPGLSNVELPAGMTAQDAGGSATSSNSAALSSSLLVNLGPEPLIESRVIQLKLGDQTRLIGTDGLQPFGFKP